MSPTQLRERRGYGRAEDQGLEATCAMMISIGIANSAEPPLVACDEGSPEHDAAPRKGHPGTRCLTTRAASPNLLAASKASNP